MKTEMHCPRCNSENNQEIDNMSTNWQCKDCGFQGMGDEFYYLHYSNCHYGEMIADRYQYFVKYPNHCSKCHGVGFFTYNYDPSPAGVSLGSGSMVEIEPCEYCLENGICPRCGAEDAIEHYHTGPFDVESKCSKCDWNSEDGGNIVPMEPYCYCWERQERELDME